MWFTAKENVITDDAKINEILTRGVEDVFVKESLVAKLKSGKQLRVKFGIDPTSSHIHIGRAVVLRKLKKFQDLGHKIVFIIGDYTAQIGDPSDKLEKRPMLTLEQIKKNLKTYKEQASKIIDFSKAELHYNSKWLSKLTFREILDLQETFTIGQMMNRRNFKERLDRGDEVSLRETTYPLMQGYDSVAIKADIEIGGFDQLFNLKAGRVIQKHFGMPEQDVLTVQMLEGTDGRKMSSSWGNIIAIDDEPHNMYGKVMAVRDDLIAKYFLLTTDILESEVERIKKDLESGMNPKEVKMRLAREIVALYHGTNAAHKAESNWVKTFSEKSIPGDARTVSVSSGELLKEVLVKERIVASKSEFTRLVEQGAITEMTKDIKISDIAFSLTESGVYKVGKKQFIKIEVK